MNRSTPEEEEKKKLTKVTTFPVTFALGEIKENIPITPNTPFKASIKPKSYDLIC